MTRIQVQAGASLLEGYTKKPPTGLCELVWNAFDADAHTVDVSIENSSLGGLDTIKVTDDGLGMTVEQANKAFSQVGDSWKRMPGTTTDSGRPVHGKYGRGRYSAFSLGDFVTWTSTARSVPGKWESLTVTGHRNHLQYFDIMPIEPQGDASGTEVTVHNITDDAQKAFDEPEGLKIRLLTEFALHLDRFPDFALSFLGSKIEPAKVINNKDVVKVALPDGITGEASLTVIEWDLTNVERRLYLCDTDGSVIQELPPNVQAPGTEFTAYLQWNQFVDHDIIFDSEDDAQTLTGRVIQAGRDALREHLKQAARKREAATIRRWKSEGIYPYKTEPVTNG